MYPSSEVAKNDLLSDLKKYTPYDDAERIDLKRSIEFLQQQSDVYSRNNLAGHVTASSWIINEKRSKALLVHHNIYKCWAPLGGHADNETDLARVAIKEAREESGIANITLLNENIIDIAFMDVCEHQRYGKCIPRHYHIDIRYLLVADEYTDLIINKDEVSDVRWFSNNEITQLNIDIMPIIERVIIKTEKLC